MHKLNCKICMRFVLLVLGPIPSVFIFVPCTPNFVFAQVASGIDGFSLVSPLDTQKEKGSPSEVTFEQTVEGQFRQSNLPFAPSSGLRPRHPPTHSGPFHSPFPEVTRDNKLQPHTKSLPQIMSTRKGRGALERQT